MKKIMWIVAMIPVVVTSVVLQFMPDIIPMHHDLEGNTDRWGSKTESFIFPVIILFITLFWHLLIYVFEKKSKNANTEKEQMEAKSSAKVLCVVGISQAIMFGIMHYFILYSSWIQANAGGEHAVIDIAKVSCILCGIIFILTWKHPLQSLCQPSDSTRCVYCCLPQSRRLSDCSYQSFWWQDTYRHAQKLLTAGFYPAHTD